MDTANTSTAGTPAPADAEPVYNQSRDERAIPGADNQGEQKVLAWNMIGFFIGASLLCGCAATVTYLPDWSQRVGLPLVFLGFTLTMLLASHLAIAGGQALWKALRSSDL